MPIVTAAAMNKLDEKAVRELAKQADMSVSTMAFALDVGATTMRAYLKKNNIEIVHPSMLSRNAVRAHSIKKSANKSIMEIVNILHNKHQEKNSCDRIAICNLIE